MPMTRGNGSTVSDGHHGDWLLVPVHGHLHYSRLFKGHLCFGPNEDGEKEVNS